MTLEKLELLKQAAVELSAAIKQKQDNLRDLETKIAAAERMLEWSARMAEGKAQFKAYVLQYYNPATNTWTADSANVFSAKDKTAIEQEFASN